MTMRQYGGFQIGHSCQWHYTCTISVRLGGDEEPPFGFYCSKGIGQPHWYDWTHIITILYQEPQLPGQPISFNCPFDVLSICWGRWTEHFCKGNKKVVQPLDWFSHTSIQDNWLEQQWRAALMDIYSHLCITDVSVKTALIQSGPRPFKLCCSKPWGYVPNDPDTSSCAKHRQWNYHWYSRACHNRQTDIM